jgi:hypothetical protein
VQLSSLDRDDLCFITGSLFPRLPPMLLAAMVDFNQRVTTNHDDIVNPDNSSQPY